MKRTVLAMFAIAAMVFTSCKKDDDDKKTDVKIKITMPQSLSGSKSVKLKEGTITFTNMNTGSVKSQQVTTLDAFAVNVTDGTYKVIFEGKASYVETNGDQNTDREVNIRGIKENLAIVGGTFDLNMDLVVYVESNGFILSEIFFSGTKTPEGKSYRQDKFFEIYNNSSETLYADGLAIGECYFSTTWAKLYKNLTPDNRESHTAIQAFYRIPGSGKDHPVKPGESIIIADVAKNHKTENANSFDLSKANFEWFDDHALDVDVAEVPNLEKVYCYTSTIWTPHSRGYNSYVLFKLDKTKDAFIAENTQEYKYVFEFNGNVKDITKQTYTIPNTVIMDAVELTAPSKYTWHVLSSALDLGWTHSGDSNDETVGHSVKRKISHTTADGRKVLLDTNNSKLDFQATATPSPGVID